MRTWAVLQRVLRNRLSTLRCVHPVRMTSFALLTRNQAWDACVTQQLSSTSSNVQSMAEQQNIALNDVARVWAADTSSTAGHIHSITDRPVNIACDPCWLMCRQSPQRHFHLGECTRRAHQCGDHGCGPCRDGVQRHAAAGHEVSSFTPPPAAHAMQLQRAVPAAGERADRPC